MSLLRILRNFAVLLIFAMTIVVSTPRPAAALFCGGTCNPRYGGGWCPSGCRCYGASTRGICLPY
jgi:hypothetical protein